MEFLTSFEICSSGLRAQRAKMDVIVTNLANAGTTRTAEGGPYKRKIIVFSSEPLPGSFNEAMTTALRSVQVDGVVEDKEGLKKVYDPGHPDADPQGFVTFPNVSTVVEMSDMITANRAYEACVTAFDATKRMALKALEIGK
ncbi:MAG: flagellar basal body rod protein FlgC [Deltaproteobacteria bacterium]|nr:flagellar basal body rod protein FlgC [Deltaproteobacteria bacterium]